MLCVCDIKEKKGFYKAEQRCPNVVDNDDEYVQESEGIGLIMSEMTRMNVRKEKN